MASAFVSLIGYLTSRLQLKQGARRPLNCVRYDYGLCIRHLFENSFRRPCDYLILLGYRHSTTFSRVHSRVYVCPVERWLSTHDTHVACTIAGSSWAYAILVQVQDSAHRCRRPFMYTLVCQWREGLPRKVARDSRLIRAGSSGREVIPRAAKPIGWAYCQF